MRNFGRHEAVDPSFGSHDVGEEAGPVAVAWVNVDDGNTRIDSCKPDQLGYPGLVVHRNLLYGRAASKLVLDGTCALAVTILDVPEQSPGTIEREHLYQAQMVTVCAPAHPLAAIAGTIPREEFGRHIQLVVTDNQPDAEKTQQGVASERQWRVNDLGAKHDLLKGGLCWGHMPRPMVAEDLANGTLVELRRRAWHMRSLTFMIPQRRGYAFSECETRLVELLGNPKRFAKESSQRSVSRKGERTRRPAMRE